MGNRLSSASRSIQGFWENPWTGRLLCFVLAVIWFWFGWHTPSAGKAGVVLGVAAAIMGSLWTNLGYLAKGIWLLLLFGFLLVEMRAIDNDRTESAKELGLYFQKISNQAQDNLKTIIDDEHKDFVNLLQIQQRGIEAQQKNFLSTMRTLANGEDRRNRDFLALLTRQEQLFRAQQEMSEFLNGKLLPAEDPMPDTMCARMARGDDVLISFGTHGNGSITNKFPHTIVAVEREPVIVVDRTDLGLLVLEVDMRDSENRIVAKLDRNGFVVNNKYTLYMLRPDKSTILIEDEYGKEVLRTRFSNPRAFSISGTLYYKGKSLPIDLPGMINSCVGHARDIEINYTSNPQNP